MCVFALQWGLEGLDGVVVVNGEGFLRWEHDHVDLASSNNDQAHDDCSGHLNAMER